MHHACRVLEMQAVESCVTTAHNDHSWRESSIGGESERKSDKMEVEHVGGFVVRSVKISGHHAGAMGEFRDVIAEAYPHLQLTVVQDIVRSRGNGHGWTWQTPGVVEVRCARGLPDLACSLAKVLNQFEADGKAFSFCESIVPMQRLCEATLGTIAETVAELAAPMFGCSDMTFAVRVDGLRALDGQSRAVWVEEIAKAVNATRTFKVDLKEPSVVVHVQIFEEPDGHRAGVCVRHGSTRLTCPTEKAKQHRNAGAGSSFYAEAINRGTHTSQPVAGICDDLPLEREAILSDRILPLLEAAIARGEREILTAGISGVDSEPFTCDWPTNSGSSDSRLGQSCSSSHSAFIRESVGSTQVAALVSHAERAGLLQEDAWFVEFGAGKGSLTAGFKEAMSSQGCIPAGFVLVDRDRMKHGIQGQSSKSFWEEHGCVRVRVDIENLCLSGISGLGSGGQRVVGIGKHVCGSATDLALRCLVNAEVSERLLESPDDLEISENDAKKIFMSYTRAERAHVGRRVGQDIFSAMSCRERLEEMRKMKGAPPKAFGVAIALCCHHCASWEHYINPNYVMEAELSPTDFKTICRASSWAVGAQDGSQRAAYGTTCKRFLDVGRAVFLARRGFHVSLCPYVGRNVTKENMMLLATRP